MKLLQGFRGKTYIRKCYLDCFLGTSLLKIVLLPFSIYSFLRGLFSLEKQFPPRHHDVVMYTRSSLVTLSRNDL